MSILEWRGGFPAVFRGTAATTGVVTGDAGESIAAGVPVVLGKNLEQVLQDGRKGPVTTKWVEIRNLDVVATNTLLVYFTSQQFTDDDHALVIPGAASALSKWEGPIEVHPPRDGDITGVWIRAGAGTPAFNITAIARRG